MTTHVRPHGFGMSTRHSSLRLCESDNGRQQAETAGALSVSRLCTVTRVLASRKDASPRLDDPRLDDPWMNDPRMDVGYGVRDVRDGDSCFPKRARADADDGS